MTSSFEALGLDADRDLTDGEVRSAWRRVAAATHPDRADGGDPAVFAAAAAAYTLLRTAAGRRDEAADQRDPAPGRVGSDPVPAQKRALTQLVASAALRVSHGRPWRLSARLLAAVAVGAVAVIAIGWQPASVAISTGALTWLVLTGRGDLAARRPVR
jgi:hypothetical protein